MTLAKIITGALLGATLTGCQMVDWHCTKGGQWSAGYTLEDGRCTYYCADADEKFCGKTTAEAEAKMANDPAIKKQREKNAEAALSLDKALCSKLGFKPETEGMANCLLTQYQNRLGLAVKDKEAEIMGAQSEAKAWSDLAKGIQNSAPRATTCNTFGSTTKCYSY